MHGGTVEFSLVHTLTNEDLVAFEDEFRAFVDLDMRIHIGDQRRIDDHMAETQHKAIDNHDHDKLSYQAKRDYVVRCRGTSWLEESDSPDETTRSQLSSEHSLASLEIPEHAHIFKSSIPRDYVDVPVFCVADTEAMPSIMSKLLHQRQIWGVHEPVLGIITSDNGLVVRLSIGWMEGHGTEVWLYLAIKDCLN